MANLRDKFGGVGGLIRKALPYVATYFVGRKLGERGTRKQAEEPVLKTYRASLVWEKHANWLPKISSRKTTESNTCEINSNGAY